MLFKISTSYIGSHAVVRNIPRSLQDVNRVQQRLPRFMSLRYIAQKHSFQHILYRFFERITCFPVKYHTKSPEKNLLRAWLHGSIHAPLSAWNAGQKHVSLCSLFFHPDFTVGTGFSPVQPHRCDMGRGLHHRQ